MGVAVRADREGDRGRVVPTGPFDLAHATAVARAVETPSPAWRDAARSKSISHISIESTGAPSCWRGCSIAWTRTGSARGRDGWQP